MHPLGGIRSGVRATIAVIPQDRDLAAELAALGILPGEDIEVVQATPFHGPILIRTGGGIYAVGRTLANRILVTARP